MISPYRLAGEMPPAPKPATRAPIDLEDDIDTAVACHHLEGAECEIARDDGFPQYVAVAFIMCFGMLALVLLLTELAANR